MSCDHALMAYPIIPSFLTIRLSSSLFRATLLISTAWISCLLFLNINFGLWLNSITR